MSSREILVNVDDPYRTLKIEEEEPYLGKIFTDTLYYINTHFTHTNTKQQPGSVVLLSPQWGAADEKLKTHLSITQC